ATNTPLPASTATAGQECGGVLDVAGFDLSATALHIGETLVLKVVVRNSGSKPSGAFGVEVLAATGFGPAGGASKTFPGGFKLGLGPGAEAAFTIPEKWNAGTGVWTLQPVIRLEKGSGSCPTDQVSPN